MTSFGADSMQHILNLEVDDDEFADVEVEYDYDGNIDSTGIRLDTGAQVALKKWQLQKFRKSITEWRTSLRRESC